MTPYARYILGRLATFSSISLGVSIAAFYKIGTLPHSSYLIAAGILLAVTIGYYYVAIGELRGLVFYYPACRIKRDGKERFRALGVKRYLDYYRVRPDDDAVRTTLKQKGGVLVCGKPLSGKTRAAIEAIIAAKPSSYILKIGPSDCSSDKIDKLIIPCLLVFFRKPEVVLFFDNIDSLDLSVIDRAFSRLTDQTSSICAVSTCDSGPKELRIRSLQGGARSDLFEAVYLDPLAQEVANEIFAEVWKGKGGPLLTDLSLPGYITLGSNPALGKVRSLSQEDKKVIQALRLAAGCGVLGCDEKLFWGILENVLISGPQDRTAILGRFIEQGMILVQNPHSSTKLIFVQHEEYLNEAYDDLATFKRDLARLGDWLIDQRDAQRMSALGSYYWRVLFDLSSARVILELAAEVRGKESSYQLTLAELYAEIVEPKLETATLNIALALSSSPVERAMTLISHGDALLYRIARPADALGYYNQAHKLIEESPDAKTLELIRRRSGDCLLKNRQFTEAEPYFRHWMAGAKADDLLDASERLVLSLVGQGRNYDAGATLRHLWANLPCAKRIERALLLLGNGEGCLGDQAQLKGASQIALDCFVASAGTTSDPRTHGEEIVLFGYKALCSGFLLHSELVHSYLMASSERMLDKEDRVAIRINLGETLYLLGHTEAAREVYQRALSIAADSPKRDRYVAFAEIGLGDCCLFSEDRSLPDNKLQEAKERYRRGLRLGEESGDENCVNGAHLGLGEVALAEKDYAKAEEHFLKLETIINSYQQFMRIWLGMARVKIHFQCWEEAESFLTRGLCFHRRRDFAVRREEFQKEYDGLQKRRAAL